MSTHAADTGTQNTRNRDDRPTVVHSTSETKPAFKTTELIAYVVVAVGVLIASAMVDQNEDGQGFGADRAWLYVTMLTIGYMVSRGLAKAGSYDKDSESRH